MKGQGQEMVWERMENKFQDPGEYLMKVGSIASPEQNKKDNIF